MIIPLKKQTNKQTYKQTHKQKQKNTKKNTKNTNSFIWNIRYQITSLERDFSSKTVYFEDVNTFAFVKWDETKD